MTDASGKIRMNLGVGSSSDSGYDDNQINFNDISIAGSNSKNVSTL